MDCIATRLPYRQTSHFARIILDYLDHSESVRSFYAYPPSLQGIQKSISNRQKFSTNRKVIAGELKKQYANVAHSDSVRRNIEAVLLENTFTITTAHQPNIFTGPLYLVYKILHAVKLSEYCRNSLPQYNFVPVYYMGSEDADLDELGHFYLDGEKIVWNTKQTGAVGRMKVDKELTRLIETISGRLTVMPFGNEILSLIKDCYQEGALIQDATFKLVNSMFGDLGLVVLIPDNAALKKQASENFEDDLLNETPSVVVEETANRLHALGYSVQVNPREINLFYLKDGMRERIVKRNSEFRIQNSELNFTKEDLLKELSDHPARFSPNVILRGIYQETILPDVVYIGGGGEIAYWLQLKNLFEYYKVPYPVLLLRNSFVIVEKKWQEKISKLGFTIEDFFLPEHELVSRLVTRETKNEIRLNGNFTDTEKLYDALKEQAVAVDPSLAQHVEALKTRSIYRLKELEKKMLRAEKRKFADQQRQIHSIKEKLFPKNGLQERMDNFMYYHAKWGKNFIHKVYLHSLALEGEFVALTEK